MVSSVLCMITLSKEFRRRVIFVEDVVYKGELFDTMMSCRKREVWKAGEDMHGNCIAGSKAVCDVEVTG